MELREWLEPLSKFKAKAYAWMVLVVFLGLIHQEAYAHKPMVHLYLGSKLIQRYGDPNIRTIALDGSPQFPASERRLGVIRKWPKYYLAGTIGPDAFPDLVFGQTRIHPDTLSGGDSGGTNTNECLQRLWDTLEEPGAFNNDEWEQALAFTLGFLAHAAGDVWGHTFVNQYAGGSWPTGYSPIIERHLLIESVVGPA